MNFTQLFQIFIDIYKRLFTGKSRNLNQFLISGKQAERLHNNYKTNQLKKLDDGADFHETESAWISYDVLMEYLLFVKARYKQEDDVDISGIRFYYSAYGSRGTNKFNPDKVKRMTLTAMPTVCEGTWVGRDGSTRRHRARNPHRQSRNDYPQLEHVTVYLKNDGSGPKNVTEYPLKNPGENENTALLMPPFPPPPHGS